MKIRPALSSAAMLALVGCGGANAPSSGGFAPPPPVEEFKMAERDPQSAPADNLNAGSEAPQSAQYIAYAYAVGLRLPVSAIEPTIRAHTEACTAAGPSVCIVTNSWLNAYSEDQANGQLQIRAAPAWIESFLGRLEAETAAARGEIVNRQTTAEDLTVSIVDTDARLNAQLLLRQRLEDLLSNRPANLGELLETQRELARVNGEIDSLKSTLAAFRQRIDMSQLSISYETKIDPLSQGALSPISDAFNSFFYNLSQAVAAVITAFAIGLPWLLLIGVLLWIWLRLIWPRIRRKKPAG